MIRTLCFITVFYIAVFKLNAQQNTNPPIVPYSAFGHWIWEDHIHTTASVNFIVNGYLNRDIPVNTVIFDSPWSTAYNNFEWDTLRYPNYKGLIKNLHEKEIKVLLWYTAMVNSSSREVINNKCPTFDYVIENNLCTSEGKIHRWMKGHGVHIDFTNPEAVSWWHSQVDNVMDMGIDGWKVDASAIFLGDSVLTSKGILKQEEFKYLYFKDIFEYSKLKNPESIIYTYGQIYSRKRNATINFPPVKYSHAQWSGDFKGNFQGLSEQLERIYNSAHAGYIAPACEIGGYIGNPSTKKELIRYTQLASVVPIMVNGGNYGALDHHLPWNHDEETVDIYRKYVNFHLKISLYLFSESVEGHLNGRSIIQNISSEEGSHQVGDNIFVQTITSPSDTVQIKFPEKNQWIDYWDLTKVYEPSEKIFKYYPIDKYPVFIKSGAILPILNDDKEKVTFMIYPDNISNYTYHIPQGNGTNYNDITLRLDAKSGKLILKSDSSRNYNFKIVCCNRPIGVKGADHWNYISDKHILNIDKKGKTFEIIISGSIKN